MKSNRSFLGYLLTFSLMGIGFLLYAVPQVPSAFASTISFTATTTSTIIGWATPNSTTFIYGVLPFILPMFVTILFAALAGGLHFEGDINSFIIKFGLLVGCLLGMLSLTGSNATLIPLALALDAAVFLVTYVWKKV